ncbi:hypothetical protein OH492_19730 [Vibrio chagasii]|nr:hypothetical protein [Vibrio chagasii]
MISFANEAIANPSETASMKGAMMSCHYHDEVLAWRRFEAVQLPEQVTTHLRVQYHP